MRTNWVFIIQDPAGDTEGFSRRTNVGANGPSFATFVEEKLVKEHTNLKNGELPPKLMCRYGNTWLFIMSPQLGAYMKYRQARIFARWVREFRAREGRS
jgi:hypothetical protein